MSDYITMQRRIWRELDRDDMTADVQAAIQSAIKFYSSKRFFFNEERWDGTSTDSQEYYQLPSNYRDIDVLRFTVNSNAYTLKRRGWHEIECMAVSPSTYTGYPTDFSVYRNELRLYPVPNGAYAMMLSGHRDLPDLSADATTNDWMTDAEELIRSRACVDLIENVLQDYDEPRSNLYRNREKEAYLTLKGESNIRNSTGKVRKAR